jgi:hypothetical protein
MVRRSLRLRAAGRASRGHRQRAVRFAVRHSSLQGFRNAFAGITLPNPASVAFHERLGFAPIGVFRQIGYKQGRWHDVQWLGRELASHIVDPPPPRMLPDLVGSAELMAALRTGESRLRSADGPAVGLTRSA